MRGLTWLIIALQLFTLTQNFAWHWQNCCDRDSSFLTTQQQLHMTHFCDVFCLSFTLCSSCHVYRISKKSGGVFFLSYEPHVCFIHLAVIQHTALFFFISTNSPTRWFTTVYQVVALCRWRMSLHCYLHRHGLFALHPLAIIFTAPCNAILFLELKIIIITKKHLQSPYYKNIWAI